VIERTGPKSPSVYWRRRALAIGGSVIALVLVVWLVGVVIGPDDPTTIAPRGATSSSPPPPRETPVVSSSTTSPSPPPPPAAVPSPTLPPGPPPPCEDAHVAVVAEIEKPAYAVGEQVGMKIVVSNTGPLPCTKEIGRHVRELVVTTADGATRLWSSNDCFSTAGSEVRVMRPGELFTYGLRWVGSTSEPGCRKHTRLGPGDYLLTAHVAGKPSPPVVFRLT
jgi:hypothetical protein